MQLLKLLRIHQWVKNTFLFTPAFFGANLLNKENTVLIPAFFLFSIVSSAIYIINDYRDIEADKLHPTKKDRPLASGAVSKSTGLILFSILILTGSIGAYLLSTTFAVILLIYFVLNIFYSFGLKHTPILEMLIVSSGFLLRVIAGAVVSNTPLSHWLIIMVFLLALFLILAKRRDDLIIFLDTGTAARKSIIHYNLDFINSSLTMLSGVIIVTYIMYTVSPEVIQRFNNEYLYGTTVFVIAGIMRYLKIALMDQKSGSPVKTLYTDKFIIITMLAWMLSFFIIIYANPIA